MSKPRQRNKNGPPVGAGDGSSSAPNQPQQPSQQQQHGQQGPKPKSTAPAPRPPQGKIVLRQLPTVGFDLRRAKECLASTLQRLGLGENDAELHHFMEGKISRKRGPVPGSCFLTFQSPAALAAFVQRCPAEVPFIEGESMELQPVVEVPLFQKTSKKERPDRLEGSIATDEDFLSFCAAIDAPPTKSATVSASSMPASSQASKDPRNSALLRFLSEGGSTSGKVKGKKAAAEAAKASKKEKQKGGKESDKKAEGGGGKGGSGKDKGGKDRDREAARGGKEKQQSQQPLSSSSGSGPAPVPAAEGSGPGQGKKQKAKAKQQQESAQQGRPQGEAVAAAPAIADKRGGGGPKEKGAGKKGGGEKKADPNAVAPVSSDSSAPVPGKITFLKRPDAGGASGSTGGGGAGGPAKMLLMRSSQQPSVATSAADPASLVSSMAAMHVAAPPSVEPASMPQIKDNRGKPKQQQQPRKQQQQPHSEGPEVAEGGGAASEPSSRGKGRGPKRQSNAGPPAHPEER